jgi:hypothetical protein
MKQDNDVHSKVVSFSTLSEFERFKDQFSTASEDKLAGPRICSTVNTMYYSIYAQTIYTQYFFILLTAKKVFILHGTN